MSALVKQNIEPQDDGLEAAFLQFSRCSEELVATYALLQEQVARLTEELEAARAARKHEAREKERLAARLSGLLGVLPAGVVAVDGKGRITEANRAARDLLGEGLVGLSWKKVMGWAAAGETAATGELRLRNNRWVALISTAQPDDSGKLHLLVEVTEQRRLQEQLAQHQRLSAIGEMMAQLAHQIRTPLTAARLSVDCLRNTKNQGQRERATNRIETQLLSLEALVNELLNLAGKGEVDENSVAVDELLTIVSVISEQRYGDKLTLEVHAAPDLRVRGNAELLGSALDSLIGNALKAGGGEAIMRIDACEDAGDVLVTVTDNGPGVNISQREKIFEPFFSASGGTGLGLTAAQSIIRAHGGSIACVDSERGARFAIRLPREKRMLLSGPRISCAANGE